MIDRSAIFSDCMKYRYLLSVSWGEESKMVWIMLNPSTATEMENDPTIERCSRRAKNLGYSGIIILNLFAYRASNPKDMMKQDNPVGFENSEIIDRLISSESAKLENSALNIYCGWGNHGSYNNRAKEIISEIKYNGHWVNFNCLDTTKSGHPVHPLYQPYDKGFKNYNYE